LNRNLLDTKRLLTVFKNCQYKWKKEYVSSDLAIKKNLGKQRNNSYKKNCNYDLRKSNVSDKGNNRP
jgi:predicted solute-binding protein